VDCEWLTPLLDVNNATPGTTANTGTAQVPLGLVLEIYGDIVTNATASYTRVSSLTQADLAPSVSASPLATAGGSTDTVAGNYRVFTNTSAQYRYRCSGNSNIRITTEGWVDQRL